MARIMVHIKMTTADCKNTKYIAIIASVFFILCFSKVSQANTITPIINLFIPSNYVPALILTILIILVETFLLWKWIKGISLKLSLMMAAIVNIISSAVGSVIAWIYLDEQMIWVIKGLYVPMFFLTLAAEIPVLKYLCRQYDIDWKRSIKVALGLNTISYIFVFIAQFGLIFIYVYYADYADKQTLNNWNDLSLLEGEGGYIYTVKYAATEEFTKYVFNRYDVENNKWEIIDPGFERGIYPAVWDVRGNLIACIIKTGELNNKPITIINSSTFSVLAKLDGNFREARISPDLSKLAVLEYVKAINTPRGDESIFMLGSGCKLKIYDIESGSLLYEAPRLALDDGLSWVGNSKIIFSALRDESLLQSNDVKARGHTYGRSYAKEGQFPIDLFVYDLHANSVKGNIEGQGPQFVPSKNEIVFFRVSGFYKRDLWQSNAELANPRLVLSDIRGDEVAISPSGKRYLILVPHKQPLGGSLFLTLVDPNNSDRKYILEPNSRFGFRWINKEIELPKQSN
jgi:hypothetical protein